MYPLKELHEAKISESLEELTILKNQLSFFQEFSGVDKLQEEAQFFLNDIENIQIENIITCKSKINNFIKLNYPIKEKIDQINYLMPLIEMYFEQTEVQTINSALATQKNKLKQLMNKELKNEDEIEKPIIAIDLIFLNRIQELLKKIKQSSLNRFNVPNYLTYLVSRLELISQSENEIKDNKEKISILFNQLNFSIEFVKHLEISIKEFEELQHSFKSKREKYQELHEDLIKLEPIYASKIKVEQQIEILNEKFDMFDPSEESLVVLKHGLQDLDYELNELQQLNQSALQNQQVELIRQIKVTQQDLSKYSKKLALLDTKSTNNKAQQLKLINSEIESLLNPENLEEDTSKTMADNIEKLKHTMNDAKDILSEYRGISLLRCFATLWGGGKVTSQLLVNTLDEQLTDLQTNMSRLSPHS